MISEKYDVIVVGAGISGLLAALVLARHGNHVLVLEKNSQIGGNCRSYRVDGFMVDTGPHAITMLNGGPLCMLMDQYFDQVPDFRPYGDYFVRSADTGELVRCPTNINDFLRFSFLPPKDRILLSSTIAAVFMKHATGTDYSKRSVYDCLPQSLSGKTFAFADAFSMFMSGRGMKETSVKRMAEGGSFSKENDMGRDAFDRLVAGLPLEEGQSRAAKWSAVLPSVRKLLYHKGGFATQGYPAGGIGSILSCLTASLPPSADIRTNCRVSRILTENGAAEGVEFTDAHSGEKKAAYADLIVYTGFASNLPRMIDTLPEAYLDQLRHIDHTISITSWIGLDEPVPALNYIGSEVQFEKIPYWGGPTSNYDPGLAPPGGQVAGFTFVLSPPKKLHSRVQETYDTLFESIRGLEDHAVMKHTQITVPDKAAITINGAFADVRTPVAGLYMAGTDTDRRSMGVTRAAYSVIDLMKALEEDGRLIRQNGFQGLGSRRNYLPFSAGE